MIFVYSDFDIGKYQNFLIFKHFDRLISNTLYPENSMVEILEKLTTNTMVIQCVKFERLVKATVESTTFGIDKKLTRRQTSISEVVPSNRETEIVKMVMEKFLMFSMKVSTI